MLFGWPFIAAYLFARLPLERAAAWSMIGGYLILPEGLSVNPPLLPPLDKTSVTILSTFLLCLAKGGLPHRRVGPIIPVLAAMFVLAPIASTFGNSYELHIGNLSIPGYYLMDGVKNAFGSLIQIGTIYIGSRFLSSPKGRFELLRTFVICLLLYTLPMLIEVRLSPQLNRWIYGLTPFSVAQSIRAGGFRPVVFLAQGLQLALFVTMALIGAVTLARARVRIFNFPAQWWAAYLAPFILLCRTLGAAVYAILLAPLATFAKPSTSVRVATAIMLVVCAYPALRTQSLVPITSVNRLASSFSQDRADSLGFRTYNEDILLAKANQKPLFGWGGWSRQRVYSAEDSKDISITDGGWIIYYGVFGWFGYLGLFGIMAISGLRLARSIKRADREDAIISAGLALMLAANMVDMIPNANLTTISFLIAGSIAGRAVRASEPARRRKAPPSDAPTELAPATARALP